MDIAASGFLAMYCASGEAFTLYLGTLKPEFSASAMFSCTAFSTLAGSNFRLDAKGASISVS